jgi:hypothetical protein
MSPSSSSSSSSSPTSIHETIQAMMKYIETGDAKDLGQLGEYLGLSQTMEDRNIQNGNGSGNGNESNEKGSGIKKPIKPIFKLPISYLPEYDLHSISPALSDDLELVVSKDPANTRPLYESLLFPSDQHTPSPSIYAKQYVYMWGETFTTNVDYLKDTQEFTSRFCKDRYSEKHVTFSTDFENVDTFWTTMKTNRIGFKDKFGYFDVPPLPIIERVEQLNNVPTALQILSVYNVSTPVISLFMPVLILILPFFIIKSRGIDINVEKYIEVLKGLASNHAIGKLFTEFSSVSFERKMYILVSVLFYIMQVYQNTMSCWRFYKNIYTIHDHLILVRNYLRDTASKMERVLRCGVSLKWYHAFNGCLGAELQNIRSVCADLQDIEPFSLSIKAIANIGYAMKHYYLFFKDASIDAMMRYTFGFNAFYEHMVGIAKHINAGLLNACNFSEPGSIETNNEPESDSDCESNEKDESNKKEKKKSKMRNVTSMQDAYFLNTHTATNCNDAIIKNDITLDKKLLITGPNAAGKTTIIKTTLFNVLLSQQIGFGVYKTATIVPYHFLHCYLNIPDTSGRDSLFQAESRRCKEILDCIAANSDKRHFGIFDELYSGTNPYEAVASAYGYIHYISDMKNVDFMLTTHYIHLCELFETIAPKTSNKKHKSSSSSSVSSSSSRSSASNGSETRSESESETNAKPKTKTKTNTNSDLTVKTKNNNIRNLHMKTTVGDSGTDHIYHYKVENGISKVRGGIKVLVDLNYPDSIIQTTKRILNNPTAVR